MSVVVLLGVDLVRVAVLRLLCPSAAFAKIPSCRTDRWLPVWRAKSDIFEEED